MTRRVFFLLLVFCFFMVFRAQALSPDEVLVIANRFVPESVELAHYYMEMRGIPKQNLLKIKTTEKEGCSREMYDKQIAEPVRKRLRENESIRALVTVYGVPLKVKQPELTAFENKQLNESREHSRQLRSQIKDLEKSESSQLIKELKEQLAIVSRQISVQTKNDYSAAVDSELSLVLVDNYSLKFWQENPYFVGFRKRTLPVSKDKVMMVSRLDAPTPEIVKRIIDDSLFAENNGLKGSAYFDAKGARSSKQSLNGYALYDQSLHLAAEQVVKSKRMPVVVNEKKELFQAGEAPDAALYCGWYSYQKYIDAFDWVRGAVGYHISSVECHTLRQDKRAFWCKSMLEDGAAAVIGPVGEPYVQAFPVPEIFFSYLTDGFYTLAESYFLSLPYLSWRMVLVGDPLYRPFKNVKKTGWD